jgi:hypothetical protein
MNEAASKFLAEDDFWKIILVSLDGTDSVGLVQDRQQQLLEPILQRLWRQCMVKPHSAALCRKMPCA